ncbi:MAG: hypothetical protein ACLT7B_08465 [[Ruminococcus] torques]
MNEEWRTNAGRKRKGKQDVCIESDSYGLPAGWVSRDDTRSEFTNVIKRHITDTSETMMIAKMVEADNTMRIAAAGGSIVGRLGTDLQQQIR